MYKGFSFPKSARLLTSHQFRRVMKYGAVASGKHLVIQMHENKKSSLKLGITVSRKFGNAVKRNRFKRLVREAFRTSQKELPCFLHINVRPQGRYADLSLNDVREELIALCASTTSYQNQKINT
jgi:ribonuclease P protein component